MATSDLEESQSLVVDPKQEQKTTSSRTVSHSCPSMNGHTNGHTNGHSNGHTNGCVTSVETKTFSQTKGTLGGEEIAPYTKVEESFNFQATHDILTMGVSDKSVEQYDHLFFPGVVPRTFVGPLILAAGSWPAIAVTRFLDPNSDVPKGLLGQIIVRSVLGLFSFAGWYFMGLGVRSQFGKTTSRLFLIVSSCQFHWLFYAGRTLPNTFALCIVNVAYYFWMKASQELIMTRIGFWKTVQEGVAAGLMSIGVAVAVDSWFWRKWMWAEGAVFWFNAIEGKSVAWGVSPWHTYLTSLLPKIATVSLPLAIVATVIEPRFRRYMLPASVFVGLYSFLGHKEWRFIIYVVPILNLGAAVMLSWVLKRKTIAYRILSIGLAAVVFLCFLASIAQSLISSLNYPGGVALQRLHELEFDHFRAGKLHYATVHIDGAAAETGCSRFGEIASDPLNPHQPVDYDRALAKAALTSSPKDLRDWTYSKDESHKVPRDYLKYTHLLTADPAFHQQNYVVLEQIDGYAGLERASLEKVKATCRSGLQKLKTAIVASPIDAVMEASHWKELWQACSPIQVKQEGRIWIMKRYGAV
ncbi:dolichyl-P-Man:Man(7)GlcNAc(2)-PP-dolichol alpha-1,6-mannosyltransferase [Podila epigama]|nr:dolichyl-P-Man:Man(7)GlcNAc(2)-PP-dolichol alpha-1,6-mannosyltransferase [Podila epigama]